MELSVYNIKGEDTGKKVVLDDAVFGIEPNDHAVYLDVKQYLANLYCWCSEVQCIRTQK